MILLSDVQVPTRLTAPSGASITIGKAPIWKTVPNKFELMNTAVICTVSLDVQMNRTAFFTYQTQRATVC